MELVRCPKANRWRRRVWPAGPASVWFSGTWYTDHTVNIQLHLLILLPKICSQNVVGKNYVLHTALCIESFNWVKTLCVTWISIFTTQGYVFILWDFLPKPVLSSGACLDSYHFYLYFWTKKERKRHMLKFLKMYVVVSFCFLHIIILLFLKNIYNVCLLIILIFGAFRLLKSLIERLCVFMMN